MTHIRILLSPLVFALLCLVAPSCSHDDVWNEVPAAVETFLNRYFPNSELESVTHTDAGLRVRIKNGPGLTFDAAGEWTVIAGYGEILPQVLLFDDLPPALYNYLEEAEVLDSVYSLERNSKTYIVGLSNTSVVYDISTGRISSPIPPP